MITYLRPVEGTESPGAILASATYKPSSLTFAEVMRVSLWASYPRARNPISRHFTTTLFLIVWFGCIGFLLGMIAWPNITPEKLAFAFVCFAMLFPLRLFVAVRRNVRILRSRGPTTIQVDEIGLTRRSDHRFTHHDWAGVIQLRRTSRDLVFLFDAGDIAWLPRRAFLDPEHESRFLEISQAGLSRVSQSASPPRIVPDR